MNNDKIIKGENKSNHNSSIKNVEKNKKRNDKMKFELNLSDYIKLIQHKKNSNFTNKKTNITPINKKGKNNKNNKSLSDKSKEKIKNNSRNKKSKEKKLKRNIDKNKEKKEKKENKKITNINIKKGKMKSKELKPKQINKESSENIFNKRLNKQKSAKLKLPSTNNTTIKKPTFKKLIRNASCKNFNNSKLKNNYDLEIKNNENEEYAHDIRKYLEVSKYEDKKRNYNKLQYYNDSNNYYIYTRRQRIEDYFNQQFYEKYKILQPLRMTSRIFFNEENIKVNNNEQSDTNIVNNLFFSEYNKKNKYIKSINKLLFNDSMNYNNYDENYLHNKNLKNYYKTVKQISASRKDLFTNEFFERKEYSLLDFEFSFHHKKRRKKSHKHK